MGTQALLTRHFSLEQLTPERPVHVLRMRGVRAIAREDERCAGLEQRQWTCADMWRTDAFADKVFSGNSAATCCACSARKRRSARLSQTLTVQAARRIAPARHDDGFGVRLCILLVCTEAP